MVWDTKCQFATTATVREEEFMLDLTFGGPMYEEVRKTLAGRVNPYV